MLPPEVYKILHILGVAWLFFALGGATLHALNGGDKASNKSRKLVAASHGIALVIILVAGPASDLGGPGGGGRAGGGACGRGGWSGDGGVVGGKGDSSRAATPGTRSRATTKTESRGREP